MTKTFEKRKLETLSLHFNSTHFDCQCKDPKCTETKINPLLIESLEVLWNLVGAFVIDSGFRCMDHNAAVGGAHDSQHLFGNAADCMSTRGYNGNLIARMAEQIIPFDSGGIGIYPGFCHVDVRGKKARWAQPFKC